MIRFIRNLTVVDWFVIAAVTLLVGTFAYDIAGTQFAARQGTADALRNIADGVFNFRVGGKPQPWFEETATVFETRYGASLVRSHGCCPTGAESNYDAAYNATMADSLAHRIDGFSFIDAFNHSKTEGLKQWEKRFAAQ